MSNDQSACTLAVPLFRGADKVVRQAEVGFGPSGTLRRIRPRSGAKRIRAAPATRDPLDPEPVPVGPVRKRLFALQSRRR
jgi:hypothetical protein